MDNELDYLIDRYTTGGDLKFETLLEEEAEVVEVEAGNTFFVPLSCEGMTVITYDGRQPYVHVNDDGRGKGNIPGNLILTMPKDTVVVADFASVSRGVVRRRKKIFTSIK